MREKPILTGLIPPDRMSAPATQTGERISVSIELVKELEDQAVWTQHYEGKAPEAITFINKIANRLQQKLAQPLAAQTVQIPTDNLEAYNENNSCRPVPKNS